MTSVDSALDPEAMTRARRLLAPVAPQRRLWPVLTAAACLAISTLAFATAMILAPPVVSQHVVASGSVEGRE